VKVKWADDKCKPSKEGKGIAGTENLETLEKRNIRLRTKVRGGIMMPISKPEGTGWVNDWWEVADNRSS